MLDRDNRRRLIPRVERTLLALEGVDLVMRMGDHPDGEAIVRGERARGVQARCASSRAATWWTRAGRAGASRATSTCSGSSVEDGRVRVRHLPGRAEPRLWSALRCPTSGEVLASARPGYEFLDWGGAHHVGGGSHGSLHANDSLGTLLWCGTGPDEDAREQWSLRDIVPMVLDHFGVNGRST